ncbi:hypothetical protein KIH27_14980 [Mycobacterium sp. M1]|uniref:SnoaL-like domain-containing protein n=1 Tax=Mycolicibacter acidiphilus TaxID=2835306 RepID=A0ABS5RKS1_9MYCO|nr:hypothetical protein [Mycolicibacter acidiphilus]MBS9534895.1 hypothetical protein [Mycolicibacter acidiphilus]
MLGPDTPDAFPLFGGLLLPADRSQVETFGIDDAEVVLDGDGTPGGHGYHRDGLGIKRDEFPAGWQAGDVVALTYAVFDHPTDGLRGRRRDSFSLYGTFRGVAAVIRVRFEENVGWRIATVHPYDALRWGDERDRLGY